jgi:hypothetical protein
MRTERLAAWLLAPVLAVSLVAFAVIGRGGPGFFLLSVVAGLAFFFGVPLLQYLLLRQPQFSGRRWAAVFVSMLVAALFLAVPVVLGAFRRIGRPNGFQKVKTFWTPVAVDITLLPRSAYLAKNRVSLGLYDCAASTHLDMLTLCKAMVSVARADGGARSAPLRHPAPRGPRNRRDLPLAPLAFSAVALSPALLRGLHARGGRSPLGLRVALPKRAGAYLEA